MERLTELDELGTPHLKQGAEFMIVKDKKGYLKDVYGTHVNKLCKLEDLEEEMGCPLEFTSTPYRLSGLRKIWYHKQWCDVVRIVVYEEMTRPYMEVRCKDYKYLKMIFLDDYKYTWWLREDKSE